VTSSTVDAGVVPSPGSSAFGGITALGSTALGSTALGSTALGSTALGSTALGSTALRSMALGRCVAVDAETFAREHWGTAPLLSRAAELPAPFTDLLDLDAADDLLSRRGLRTPFVRIARNGEVLDSGQFTGPGGVGAEIADQVRDDEVMRLFADGCTVVLQGLHRTHPSVIDFVGRLSAELGHPCQANAYLTPAASRGFSAHYDVHDVFVLQLAGGKHWTVHNPVHVDPLRSQPWGQHRVAVEAAARDRAPVIDTVLRPGDALYLPRGYLHAATALGEVSAHLTVGIHTVTRFALVEAILELLSDEPRLRRSLPLGIDAADPDQLAPHLDAVRDVLGEVLRSVRAEDLVHAVRGRVWMGNRPEPVRPLAHARFVGELRTGDVVRRRDGLRHRLHADADGLVLELPDRTITFPDGIQAALRALLAGDAVTVGTLPELDEPSQLVLVRRLLREGVLVPAGAAGGNMSP
jgi:bifunctional lysine-specific demethylase and histidyl-hydroxylase NO66